MYITCSLGDERQCASNVYVRTRNNCIIPHKVVRPHEPNCGDLEVLYALRNPSRKLGRPNFKIFRVRLLPTLWSWASIVVDSIEATMHPFRHAASGIHSK